MLIHKACDLLYEASIAVTFLEKGKYKVMPDFSLLDPAAAVVTASPWLSELRGLPLHFKPTILPNLKEINNVFATIFSGAFYIFVRNSPPNYLIDLWPWWTFLILSFVCFITILSLLLWKKKDVNNDKTKCPIVLHSGFYIILFCSITMGCGLVKLLEDHVYLDGKAIEAEQGSSVKNVLVQLYDVNEKIRCQVQGDAKGHYETLISKDTFGSIKDWRLEISAKGYDDAKIPIADGDVLFSQWRQVILFPQNGD